MGSSDRAEGGGSTALAHGSLILGPALIRPCCCLAPNPFHDLQGPTRQLTSSPLLLPRLTGHQPPHCSLNTGLSPRSGSLSQLCPCLELFPRMVPLLALQSCKSLLRCHLLRESFPDHVSYLTPCHPQPPLSCPPPAWLAPSALGALRMLFIFTYLPHLLHVRSLRVGTTAVSSPPCPQSPVQCPSHSRCFIKKSQQMNST